VHGFRKQSNDAVVKRDGEEVRRKRAGMLDSAAVISPSPLRVRSSEEGSTQISWWTVLLTLAVAATCLLSGLGALGLVGPDEPRYMSIARAMLRSGDWVTPRLYAQPWFEKPALYYWGGCGGVSFISASTSSPLACRQRWPGCSQPRP
jgi:hypothetical protein